MIIDFLPGDVDALKPLFDFDGGAEIPSAFSTMERPFFGSAPRVACVECGEEGESNKNLDQMGVWTCLGCTDFMLYGGDKK